jgi:uncharacterized membrane protein YczE
MTFVAGSYSATYNSLALGIIEDGFTIDWVSRAEDIVADVGGTAPIDGVYQGLEMQVSFTLSEWDAAAAQSAFWPFANTIGEVGRIGTLLSSLAKTLVLTKCANTSAAPTTITFQSAILAPGFSVSTLWANKHRKIPLQMRILPIGLDSVANLQQCELLRLFTVG